jgi:hypothetical protein
MIPPEEYAPAVRGKDPLLAFVTLEAKFREKLNANLDQSDGSGAFDNYVIEYMNHTIAAARALNLDVLDAWDVPSHNRHNLFDTYKDFTAAVDNLKVQVHIERAINLNRFSVALSTDDKDQLRNYVAQIKTVLDNSSLPTPKKERLYDKINAFLAEVDRDRTPWEQFADLVIGLSHLGGEAAQELEPARKLINSIARLLGRGKEFEDSAQSLPPPQKPRQIPGPKKKIAPPARNAQMADMDEEIPF